MSNKWLVFSLVAIWALPAGADTSAKASARNAEDRSHDTAHRKDEKANMITNQDAWKIYQKYLTGWKAISDDQRTKLAAEVIADNFQYHTPRHESGGRETVIEDMAAFQNKFPGGHFDVGDVSAHHDVALLTWVLVQADGTVFARGHDQLRVSADGKIVSLITFAPSVSRP